MGQNRVLWRDLVLDLRVLHSQPGRTVTSWRTVTLGREGSCGGLCFVLVRPTPFRLRETLLPAHYNSLPRTNGSIIV